MWSIRLCAVSALCLLLLTFRFCLPVRGAVAAPTDIAVVVNSKTPVDNLSMGELRRIGMGDRQFWTAGQRITILIRAAVAHERTVVLKKVYQMSEPQFRQYWVAKVFRAEVPSGPKVVYSNQTALELIESLPGAIAFVDAAQVPKGLKVVKIDGRLPADKDYPLQ
jgi:ABC-type phosphate transport system substrate-binding protein